MECEEIFWTALRTSADNPGSAYAVLVRVYGRREESRDPIDPERNPMTTGECA